MNCIDAKTMITPFIQDKLNTEQLEAFLQHVNNCPSCMEELEIYYVVLMAVQQLDEDKELSNDYRAELKNKLARCEEKIRRSRFTKVRRRVMLIAAILSVGLFSGIQITEKVVVSPPKQLMLTGTCSFRLREGFFIQERDEIELMFIEKNELLLQYVDQIRNPEHERPEKVDKESPYWNVME